MSEQSYVVLKDSNSREIRTYVCEDWEIQGDFIVLFDSPIEGERIIIKRRAERIPAAVTRIVEVEKK